MIITLTHTRSRTGRRRFTHVDTTQIESVAPPYRSSTYGGEPTDEYTHPGSVQMKSGRSHDFDPDLYEFVLEQWRGTVNQEFYSAEDVARIVADRQVH